MSHTDNHTTRLAGRRFAHRLTRRADRHNARQLRARERGAALPLLPDARFLVLLVAH